MSSPALSSTFGSSNLEDSIDGSVDSLYTNISVPFASNNKNNNINNNNTNNNDNNINTNNNTNNNDTNNNDSNNNNNSNNNDTNNSNNNNNNNNDSNNNNSINNNSINNNNNNNNSNSNLESSQESLCSSSSLSLSSTSSIEVADKNEKKRKKEQSFLLTQPSHQQKNPPSTTTTTTYDTTTAVTTAAFNDKKTNDHKGHTHSHSHTHSHIHSQQSQLTLQTTLPTISSSILPSPSSNTNTTKKIPQRNLSTPVVTPTTPTVRLRELAISTENRPNTFSSFNFDDLLKELDDDIVGTNPPPSSTENSNSNSNSNSNVGQVNDNSNNNVNTFQHQSVITRIGSSSNQVYHDSSDDDEDEDDDDDDDDDEFTEEEGEDTSEDEGQQASSTTAGSLESLQNLMKSFSAFSSTSSLMTEPITIFNSIQSTSRSIENYSNVSKSNRPSITITNSNFSSTRQSTSIPPASLGPEIRAKRLDSINNEQDALPNRSASEIAPSTFMNLFARGASESRVRVSIDRGTLEDERRVILENKRKNEEWNRELEKRKVERKVLEVKDAQNRLNKLREKIESGGGSDEGGVDETLIPPEYIDALKRVIQVTNGEYISPDHFTTGTVGYSSFISFNPHCKTMSNLLIELLDSRFTFKFFGLNDLNGNGDSSGVAPGSPSSLNGGSRFIPLQPLGILQLKIIEAKDLHSKPGKSRSPYVRVEFGAFGDTSVKIKKSGSIPSAKQKQKEKKSSSSSNTTTPPGSPSIPNRTAPNRNQIQIYRTPIREMTNHPVFDTVVPGLYPRSVRDKVVLSVWDEKKGYFLGGVEFSAGVLMAESKAAFDESEDSRWVRKWIDIKGRGKKGGGDKYVGGQVLIEFMFDDSDIQQSPMNPLNETPQTRLKSLEQSLITSSFDTTHVYIHLLKSSLNLDLSIGTLPEIQSPSESISPTTLSKNLPALSEESKANLNLWASRWKLSEAFCVLAFLEVVYEFYVEWRVPGWVVVGGYEEIYVEMKKDATWLSEYEKPRFMDLLDVMGDHFQSKIIQYREVFPKNMPAEALETSLLMLRLIYKNSMFRGGIIGGGSGNNGGGIGLLKKSPSNGVIAPASFRVELKNLLFTSTQTRLSKLSALNTPLNLSDPSDTLTQLTRLLTHIYSDLSYDVKYFAKAFKMELDLLSITTPACLDFIVLKVEEACDTFLLAVEYGCIGVVLGLMGKLRRFKRRLLSWFPSLSTDPRLDAFNVDRWFTPFMHHYMEHLDFKTVAWVTAVVRADSFTTLEAPGTENQQDVTNVGCSTSIMDLFKVLHVELDAIWSLKWETSVQNAGFLLKYSQLVSRAIEQYCDAITLIEEEPEIALGPSWTSLMAIKSSQDGPVDISKESCIKLCNIEYALKQLNEMYQKLDAADITKTIQDHRNQIRIRRPSLSASPSSPAMSDTSPTSAFTLKGAFRIQIVSAENLKPVTKLGSANPYLSLRVPEFTAVPAPEVEGDMTSPTSALFAHAPFSLTSALDRRTNPHTPKIRAGEHTILSGDLCEVARSRIISDTVNPVWDETFTALLPPITRLEVNVCSGNLLTADEVCGSGLIDFGAVVGMGGKTLRDRLKTHLGQDVRVELKPQGRVMMRLTLEGDEDDLEFWFRRSRQSLIRCKDYFIRSVCSKITPYMRQVMTKCVKEQEGAVSRSFFTTFTQGVTSLTSNSTLPPLSRTTSSGISTDALVTSTEADIHLAPLTDYLNKNLALLSDTLPPPVLSRVIARIWEETLIIHESILVPPLYGSLEPTRRQCNPRQVSMLDWSLRILRDFFHADGASLGLTMTELEGAKRYGELIHLSGAYFVGLDRLKREYELALAQGKERELCLRLFRMRVEREGYGGEMLSPEEKVLMGKWMGTQLVKRQWIRFQGVVSSITK